MPGDDDDRFSLSKLGRLPAMLEPEQFAPRIPRPVVFADATFESLRTAVEKFQKGIDRNEEVGAVLAHFGQSIVISIERIGYRNPYLITFVGLDGEGRRCELVQHMSQVNLLLVALPAKHEPARRIGFESDEPKETKKKVDER